MSDLLLSLLEEGRGMLPLIEWLRAVRDSIRDEIGSQKHNEGCQITNDPTSIEQDASEGRG